jgi:nucleoside-diphosphate-sugar epimerase
MRVLVTGGTGFVGSHSVAAVLRAGHQVRLLVRDPARVGPALGPLGVTASEVADVVTGEVTDPAAVAAAVRGCDAVLHAAGLYSFDPRDRARLLAVNAGGAETVLAAGCEAGCDPVVHVSTFAALLPAPRTLRADSPVGDIGAPYGRSKAAADRVARRWQNRGAPVVISYPGLVLGPGDPGHGESNRLLAAVLRGRVPVRLPGLFPLADVRYVAEGHAAVLAPGRGPRRYLLTGRDVPGAELRAQLRRLTGRRLPAVPVPGPVLLLGGRLADLGRLLLPGRLPVGHEAPYLTTAMPPTGTDSSATGADLGVQPPPLADTLADTVRWLVRSGRLPAKAAGLLGVGDHAEAADDR